MSYATLVSCLRSHLTRNKTLSRTFGLTAILLPLSAMVLYAVGDPCIAPGVSVVTDPAGDVSGTTVGNVPGTPAQDIVEVLISEPPQGNGSRKIAGTIKLAGDLSTLPTSGIWRVFFKPASPPTGITAYFVGVFNDPINGLTYNYGSVGTPTTTTLGAADSGSINVAAKTMTIVIDVTKVGNPAAGSQLTQIYGRTQTLVGAAGTGATPTHDIAPDGGATAGGAYTMLAAPCATATPTPTPTPTPSPTPSGAGAPRFFNYVSPQGIADSFGEPSIGSNWTTEKLFSNSGGSILNGGTTLFFGGFSPALARITFDDCSSPAGALWEAKTLLTANTPRAFGDPIMFTDHDTGRTFVSQLEGLTPLGSTTDITDNDGDTFLPSEGSSLPSDLDHQTIGGGPFHAPLAGTLLYPNAIYYASQSVADARASVSTTGGFTFGPAFPMYTVADCAGLHGHIKVAPNDGTVYVPQKACGNTIPFHSGDLASAIVSEDNGTTWAIRKIPGAVTAADRDPSIGVANDGKIYLGYQGIDGRARIAYSTNKGVNWSTPVDVGASLGIQNMWGPTVAAGDSDRAAFCFYGTTTAGTYNDPGFPGVWYLYLATTFDGGVTWSTQNLTPNDPIQRGGICGAGTCRNHLDFYDMTIDREGRLLIGYTDGCVSASCINGGANDFTAKGVIARQAGGKRMFAASDPSEPAIPQAPMVSGSVNGANTQVTLAWPVPDHSGSPITGYKIYRGPSENGPFTLLAATVVNTYIDTTFDPMVQNYYTVRAVNAMGDGPYCHAFHPVSGGIVYNPCILPGMLVNNDFNPDGTESDAGANTPPDPRVNVRQLFVAEPALGAGVKKLVFTMKMQPSPTLTTPPPNSQWYIIWQRLFPDADFDRYYVAMVTDAAGTVSYDYGKFGVPLDATNPNPNANVPVRLGAADSGSYDAATGVLTITLSNSKAENVDVGQGLSRVNVRSYISRPDPGPRTQSTANDITGDSNYTLVGNAACAIEVPVIDVRSRKTHGPAGEFDIFLPRTGQPGIECRTGGANGDYKVVFTFANPVAGVTNASVTGTGTVSSRMINSANTNQYIVNLTGVTTVQTLTITLSNVTDTAGNTTPALSVPMGVLVGDSTANGVVNASDIGEIKARSGLDTNETNFRDDITANGVVNSSDVGLAKVQSGAMLSSAEPNPATKSPR